MQYSSLLKLCSLFYKTAKQIEQLKGLVILESLKNPKIIDNFECINIKLDEDWHIYTLLTSIQNVNKSFNLLAKNMKNTYYAHFWNDEYMYVILPNKIFKVLRKENKNSKQYNKMKEYAINHGVKQEHLDFLIED